MKAFSDLLSVHHTLDRLFLEHQRALLRLEIENAASLLSTYECELLAHIRDEEEAMLPLYRERAEHELGGAPEIFSNEHEKLKQYLALFRAEVGRIKNKPDMEMAVIWLLDSQTTFKRLLSHHDIRERKFLYPALDRVTSEAEREDLFRQFALTPVASSNFGSAASVATPRLFA
jgi:hemerythrin-like domain-containing protein